MESTSQSPLLPVVARTSEEPSPAVKRRRLETSSLAHHVGRQYENAIAQGNSRNVFGDVNNTYNVYPQERDAAQPPAEEADKDANSAARLMDLLAFDQMDARLETISKAHAKTCRWLFGREEYKTWRDPEALHIHRGFFWIKGKPGAGKSTLMKSALLHGKEGFEDTTISFFFNARGEELQRSLEGMYRSLLYQLLEKMPRLSAALPKRRDHSARQGWTVEILRDMFEAALLSLGPEEVTCYVDALDECDDGDARTMVESFESLGQSTREANVCFRVLLSSRRYPYITIGDCLELDLEGQEGHEADIADYIRCKLKIGKSKIATEIRAAIQARASGIFLWVVLVIRILNECDSRGRTHLLKKRLETIPEGLSELFDEILRRGTDTPDELILTFQWILFAQRPLTREELYFAIITDSDDGDIPNWDHDEITTDAMDRFLLDASRGLAELTRGKSPKVQFIHESVKEYLLSTGLTYLEPKLRAEIHALSHERLRDCCHRYLRKSGPALLPSYTDGMKEHMSGNHRTMRELRDRIASTHPFLSYAIDGIINHAELAQSHCQMQDEFLKHFPLELWRRLYNQTRVYHSRRLSSESTMVYVFVLTNAPNLVSLAMKTTSPELEYTALALASTLGHEHIIKLLINHGADINKFDKNAHTVLYTAALHGHSPVVKLLLSSGADPNARGHHELADGRRSVFNGMAPTLHLALGAESDESVRILLDHADLDVHAVDDVGEHAVTLASLLGSEDSVKALLSHNVPQEHLNRALSAAVKSRQDAIVSMLTAKGASHDHEFRFNYGEW